jgi:hypothetical protein
MNTDLDTARVVRSWLRTDEHESADRVLDTVLALLDATPQHRSSPVRRFADMNTYAKFALVAAAVLVVALGRIQPVTSERRCWRSGRDINTDTDTDTDPSPIPEPVASVSGMADRDAP